MKNKSKIWLVLLYLALPSLILAQNDKYDAFQKLKTEPVDNGLEIEIVFYKGLNHYYPLMAIWVEDTLGNYVHSLYVAESIAKGTFEHGKTERNKWVKGEKRIPSALPYWAHQRGVRAEDSLFIPSAQNPMPDAFTGATPTHNFILYSRVDTEKTGDTFRLLFEINQAWDWNKYWYNSKYPGNREYMKSAQPALVYEVTINTSDQKTRYEMNPVGHSHPYGADGSLNNDLSTLTSALKIAEKIKVKIR